MSEDPDGSATLDEHYTALLSLHALTGESLPSPGLIPGMEPMATGPALVALAGAPVEDVPVSARLGVLGDLARAGFPDWETEEKSYLALVDSVASLRNLDSGQLLDDLRAMASDRVPFHVLPSGRALPHHEAAFVGQDVCTVRQVTVGGLQAVWVFSEFETDAPFDKVADWVDPRNWPRRGPLLFKSMQLVGGNQPVSLGPPGDEHWHAILKEEVQLVQRVNTLLHCDYWRDGARAAGMTYDLSLSLDNQIDVDRGFLLVNDVGGRRRVKALKIVGFKDAIWDRVAAWVCPFWTDWVRAAVQGGSQSAPIGPVDPARSPGLDGGTDQCPWLEPAAQWIDFMGDSARTYLHLLDEIGMRQLDPDLSAADRVKDQRRVFSQLAQDWSKAWTFGLDTLAQVAAEGLENGVAPPDRSAGARGAAAGAARSATGGAAPTTGSRYTEGTVIPMADLTDQDSPTVSDLVSIEFGGAVIPAQSLATSVERLAPRSYGLGLRVQAASASPGLYVGHATTRPGASPLPVQLYISGSTGA